MLNMIDVSGIPRTIKELIEARDAAKKELVQFKTPSPLMIHLSVIIEALDELIEIRQFLESRKANALPSTGRMP